MATFSITNISSDEVHLGDFYLTIAAGETKTLSNRSVDEVSGLSSVQREVADGNITFTVTPTADELASGLMAPPNSISGDDFQEVAAAAPLSGVAEIRSEFAAGGGGSPDDVALYAANALPYKFRVLDAHVKVSTAVGGSTLLLRDEAAGAGTLLASMSGAATGRSEMSDNLTAVATPGATKGLFLRRSDNGVAGEVIITIRRES